MSLKDYNLLFLAGADALDNQKALQFIKQNYKSYKKLVYIPFQKEGVSDEVQANKKQFKKIGVHLSTLFLEEETSLSVKNKLLEADIIFLGGGNTFYFYDQLKKMKLKAFLKNQLKSGKLIIGLSAGAIMLTPSLLMACYPSKDADDYTVDLKNMKALGYVNFEVCPHYKSSKSMEKDLEVYSSLHSNLIYALKDGEFISLQEGSLSFSGKAIAYSNGRKLNLV